MCFRGRWLNPQDFAYGTRTPLPSHALHAESAGLSHGLQFAGLRLGGSNLGPNELQKLLPVRHQCKDCDKWYGQEDDEYGPCMYKNARGEKRYVTYGYHDCDEREELERRVELWRKRKSASSSGGT